MIKIYKCNILATYAF